MSVIIVARSDFTLSIGGRAYCLPFERRSSSLGERLVMAGANLIMFLLWVVYSMGLVFEDPQVTGFFVLLDLLFIENFQIHNHSERFAIIEKELR